MNEASELLGRYAFELSDLRRRVSKLEMLERFAPMVCVRVYNDADFENVSNTTWTAITYNSERWDTHDMHSTVSNTSRLTAVIPGYYLITGNATFDTNDTGARFFAIYYNGSTEMARVSYDATTVTVNGIVTTIMYLDVDDYVELKVYQNSGGDLDILHYNNYSPEFMMARIA